MIKKVLKFKYLAYVLIFLTIISSYLALNSVAKYSNTISRGSTKKIAKFDVEYIDIESSNNITVTADNSSLTNYRFKIKNLSEVAITCSAVITNLPNGIKVKIDSLPMVTPTNGVATIENFGTINANQSPNEIQYTLSFMSIKEINDMSNVPIDVDIVCNQKNPNN